MKPVTNLLVSILLGKKKIELGELVSDKQKIYFKYSSDFIKTDWQISPFKLPLSTDILTPKNNIFDGLFGVFNDSLPDGWGRLLLDRMLVANQIPLTQITPLDRLAFVGMNGMGALVYEPAAGSVIDFEKNWELDAIAKETQKVLAGSSSDMIEELVQLGGSSAGARPKIFVAYHPEKDHLIYKKENLPKGYEHWIIKFSATNDPPDIAQIEYAYHQMAIDAGLQMTPCRLFKSASGKAYFGTKRFDRIGNQRLHLHSASGLMHDDFRLSNMDYGHLMDAAFRLENHVDAYAKVLRLAAFNVFAHNRDDHSKNFSFLMDSNGTWQMSPAYDLTFSFSTHGFHSTAIAGEAQSPNSKHLLELADIFGVKNPKRILDEVKEVVSNWKIYAKNNGLSKSSRESIGLALKLGKG